MALFPKTQQERRGGGRGTSAAKKTTPRQTKQVRDGKMELEREEQGLWVNSGDKSKKIAKCSPPL